MMNIDASLIRELRARTGIGVMECKQSLIAAQGNIELAIINLRTLGKLKLVKKAMNRAVEGMIITQTSKNNQYAVILELNCETDFVTRSVGFKDFGKLLTHAVINENIKDISYLRSKFEEQLTMIISSTGENIVIRRFNVLEGDMVVCYSHQLRIGVLVSAENAEKILLKNIAMHIAASKPEYINSYDIPSELLDKEKDIYIDLAVKSGKPDNIVKKIVEGQMFKFKNNISLMNQLFIMDNNKTVGEILNERNVKINDFVRFELGETS